jgi:acyl-CoA synthetase (AMP-forming)/AMP-acid ligase II
VADRRHNCYARSYEQDHPELVVSDVPAILEPRLDGPGTAAPAARLAHRVITYRELLERVARLASQLARMGARAGERVLIMAPMSASLYEAMFATMKTGAACLFVDPSDGMAHLERIVARMQPRVFVGSPKAHRVRLACPAVARIAHHVATAPCALPAEQLDELVEAGDAAHPTGGCEPDDPALISFTSGSTGRPKGSVRSHSDLRTQFAILCRHEGKRLTGVHLCGFPQLPVDDLCAGRTSLLAHHPPGRLAEADPALVVEQMAQHPPVLVSCPPSMLAGILERCRAGARTLPSVRHVYTGAARVPASTIRLAREVMPAAEIHVVYGSTEVEPVSMIDGAEILAETAARTARGEGTCVGRPGPDVAVEIVAPVVGPIESLEPVAGIGEILVSAPHVNREYYQDPEATRLHKLIEPGSGRLWHRMGDLGYRDAQGRLWLVGRAAHRVETPEGTLHTGQVEPRLDDVPGVRRAALIAVPVVVENRPATAAALLVELAPGDDGRRAAAMDDVKRIASGLTPPVRWIQEVRRIPLDARIGAKVLYAELSASHGPLIRQRLSDPFSTRLAQYLDERFPVRDTLVGALLFATGLTSAGVLPWWSAGAGLVAAGAAVFLFFFHLRVFDEQKDLDRDRVLHPERVLSRGIVSLDELSSLGRIAIASGALLAVLSGASAALAWGVAFAYSWLMRREFFAPDALRRHIVLYGASHVCVVFLLAQFVAAAAAPGGGLLVVPGAMAVLIGWFSEIARKLDPPDEAQARGAAAPPAPAGPGELREESYVVELGMVPTCALLASLQAGIAATASWIGRGLSMPLPAGAVIAVAGAASLAATLGFALRPSRRSGKRVHKASLVLALACYGVLASRPAWTP